MNDLFVGREKLKEVIRFTMQSQKEYQNTLNTSVQEEARKKIMSLVKERWNLEPTEQTFVDSVEGIKQQMAMTVQRLLSSLSEDPIASAEITVVQDPKEPTKFTVTIPSRFSHLFANDTVLVTEKD